MTRQWAHCRLFVLCISIAGYARIATLFRNNFLLAFCPRSCYNITRHRTVLRSAALGGRCFLRSLPPPSCLFLLSAAPAVGDFSPFRASHTKCNPLPRSSRHSPRTSSESVRSPAGRRGRLGTYNASKAQCSLSCNGNARWCRTRTRYLLFLFSCCFLSQPDNYIIAHSWGIATPREIFLPTGVGVSSPVSQFHPSFRLVLVAVVRFLGEPFGEFCEFFLGCVLQCFFVHVVFLSQLDNYIIAYPRGDCNSYRRLGGVCSHKSCSHSVRPPANSPHSHWVSVSSIVSGISAFQFRRHSAQE